MKASITLPYDKRILDLFAPEDREISRARYTIERSGEDLVFDVTAQDAVALRTVLASITRLLSLWQRSEAIA